MDANRPSVPRWSITALGAGLVGALLFDWLGRPIPGSSTEVRWKPIDLLHRLEVPGPELYLDLRFPLVVFGVALIVLVAVPPHHLAALLAALAGALATFFVLLSAPTGFGWQPAPYLALLLWLVALDLTARAWWRRRVEDYAGGA